MFCVECGREVEDDDQLRGGICVDCFLERNPILVVPDVLDLVRCPSCGAIRVGSVWSEPSEGMEDPDEAVQDAAADAAEAAVQVLDGAMVRTMDVTVHREARSAFSVTMEAQVSLMDRVVDVRERTRVRVKGEQCPVCSRIAGEYYEALIQFRGTAERPATEQELERARSHVLEDLARLSGTSREVYLVKEEMMHGGLDFYISTQPAAAQIAKGLASDFGATASSSTKVTGRKDGRDVVRVTHAIRLPDLRRGDYVLSRGTMLRVVSASTKEATVDPAAGTGRRRHVSRGELHDLRLVGDSESREEAVVVSSSGTEAQVLDPRTMRTVDLVVPEGYTMEGRETVMVVRADDLLYIVE
ncbi:MAG: hypothetical protein GWN18_04335 [Thermoplasmata archaeon]|nr:hypothetical protein [Thermoplasmata archaeon]NIS11264.1 hypothetical protein [Thermoplasmata archaeon]NIS19198.1 hypothetical protein [Thermoplasmata archaeon]NIT76252.1 hypothetical protein [Thermoplasmata archaeon]NIU48333.1 hypothetical protein [Thermoplasmata archaeon]